MFDRSNVMIISEDEVTDLFDRFLALTAVKNDPLFNSLFDLKARLKDHTQYVLLRNTLRQWMDIERFANIKLFGMPFNKLLFALAIFLAQLKPYNAEHSITNPVFTSDGYKHDLIILATWLHQSATNPFTKQQMHDYDFERIKTILKQKFPGTPEIQKKNPYLFETHLNQNPFTILSSSQSDSISGLIALSVFHNPLQRNTTPSVSSSSTSSNVSASISTSSTGNPPTVESTDSSNVAEIVMLARTFWEIRNANQLNPDFINFFEKIKIVLNGTYDEKRMSCILGKKTFAVVKLLHAHQLLTSKMFVKLWFGENDTDNHGAQDCFNDGFKNLFDIMNKHNTLSAPHVEKTFNSTLLDIELMIQTFNKLESNHLLTTNIITDLFSNLTSEIIEQAFHDVVTNNNFEKFRSPARPSNARS